MGVTFVVAAAYAYVLLFSAWGGLSPPMFSTDWFAELVFFPLLFILPWGWFLLPLGAALGWLMPQLFRGRGARWAFPRGAVLGLAISPFLASFVALFDLISLLLEGNQIGGWEVHLSRFTGIFLEFIPGIIPFCVVGVAIWAVRLGKKSNLESVV